MILGRFLCHKRLLQYVSFFFLLLFFCYCRLTFSLSLTQKNPFLLSLHLFSIVRSLYLTLVLLFLQQSGFSLLLICVACAHSFNSCNESFSSFFDRFITMQYIISFIYSFICSYNLKLSMGKVPTMMLVNESFIFME